jgi:hypothetical protein
MMAVITHNKSSLKPKTAPKFLRSLYDMLHFEDPDILAWSHDGAFFQVFDVRRLEQEVLAKYFKHNKFTSLQRQLNNFGFRKWTKTRANVCTFSHDVLRRCHPDELSEMVQYNKVARVGCALSVGVGVGVGVSVVGKRSRSYIEFDAAAAAAVEASVDKKQRTTMVDDEFVGSFVAALEETMLSSADLSLVDLDLDLELVLDCASAVGCDDVSLLFNGITECQLLDLNWDVSVADAITGFDAFSDAGDANTVREEVDASTDLLMLNDDNLLILAEQPKLACTVDIGLSEAVFTF